MPKSPTPAQPEASRRNGVRSHEPTTPQGKAASLAPLDHTVLLTGESAARFSALQAQAMEETQVPTVGHLATAASVRVRSKALAPIVDLPMEPENPEASH